MTNTPEVPDSSTSSPIAVWVQVLSISVATGASLLYAGVITPAALNYDPSNLPGARAFNIVTFVTFFYAFSILVVSAPHISIPVMKAFFPERGDDLVEQLSASKVGKFAHRYQNALGVAALLILAVLCSTLLGWDTLGSGGTVESPFKDALLAIALLSPFIANSYRTPLAIGALVIVVYLIFSQTFIVFSAISNPAPLNVSIITTIVTTVTALAIASAVKWGATRKPPAPTYVVRVDQTGHLPTSIEVMQSKRALRVEKARFDLWDWEGASGSRGYFALEIQLRSAKRKARQTFNIDFVMHALVDGHKRRITDGMRIQRGSRVPDWLEVGSPWRNSSNISQIELKVSRRVSS